MTKVLTAKYEKGVIQPEKPLKLPEGQELTVAVITPDIFDEAKKNVFDFDIKDYVTKEDILAWK